MSDGESTLLYPAGRDARCRERSHLLDALSEVVDASDQAIATIVGLLRLERFARQRNLIDIIESQSGNEDVITGRDSMNIVKLHVNLATGVLAEEEELPLPPGEGDEWTRATSSASRRSLTSVRTYRNVRLDERIGDDVFAFRTHPDKFPCVNNRPTSTPGNFPDLRVTGAVSKDAIRATLKGKRPELEACYRRGIALGADDSSTVAIRFVIAADGHVTEVRGDRPTGDVRIQQCLLGLLRESRFPTSEQGTTARYWFQFSPENPSGLVAPTPDEDILYP